MRQPTPDNIAFDWWKRALAGQDVPRHDGIAHCGFYKRRWIKDGPWVPVRIFIESDVCPKTGELTCDEILRIEIEGLDAGEPAKHWTYLKPISEEAFNHLIDMRLRDTRFFDSSATIDLSQQPTFPQGAF